MNNKKANIEDIPTALVILFTLAVLMLFGSYVFDSFNTKYQALNMTDNSSKVKISTYNSKLSSAYDYGFLILLVGLLIFSVVMARKIPTSVVFYVFAIIAIIAIFAISILLSYVYDKLINANALLAAWVVNLPFINFIMPRLIFYAIIYSVAVGIALYTKDN